MSKVSQRTINQITDAAVIKGWNADQSYRDEAIVYTREFLAKFGIFVGLYNRLNNTSFSVEQALWKTEILDKYTAVSFFLQGNSSVFSITAPKKFKRVKIERKPKTTKTISYQDFQTEHGTSVAYCIYKFLKQQNEPFSRAEIAKQMGIRLSTVCGQIFSMEEAGLVTVVGTKLDEESQRTVEILVAR